VSSARLMRGGRCLAQVTLSEAGYRRLEGEPRLQGIRQLAALSTGGWLPAVRCRCCCSVGQQAGAGI
jgi:hypothetical protein